MIVRKMSLRFVSAVFAGCLLAGGAVAQDVTHEQLVELAKKEGTLTIYSNSSRHSKAGEEFEKKYGIKVSSTQLKDIEIIEKISREAAAKLKGADLVFVQDSGRVLGELIEPGYLTNYVPPEMKEKLLVEDQDPLVFEFFAKVIIFNAEFGEQSPITNIWQLTDPDWTGRFQFKDPFQEGVNVNFLTMLIKPELSQKIADAYKVHYGKDIELTTPNAGYEWMKKFFANGVVLGTSDTKISELVGASGQKIQFAGLFTANKLRMEDRKGLTLLPAMEVNPFVGFYYPMYGMIPTNSQNTNAAKLFLSYVMSMEGFAPWSNNFGDYSPNPDIPLAKGDMSIREWDKLLVREDPEWCFEHRAEVEEFLNSIL